MPDVSYWEHVSHDDQTYQLYHGGGVKNLLLAQMDDRLTKEGDQNVARYMGFVEARRTPGSLLHLLCVGQASANVQDQFLGVTYQLFEVAFEDLPKGRRNEVVAKQILPCAQESSELSDEYDSLSVSILIAILSSSRCIDQRLCVGSEVHTTVCSTFRLLISSLQPRTVRWRQV